MVSDTDLDLVVNGGLGLLVGTILFGPGPEAVLLAGIIYISSSGIISRALFDFRRLADDESRGATTDSRG